MRNERHLQSISDSDLLRRLSELLTSSRNVEAELIAHLAEVDARRLYVPYASSLFSYATNVLHMSEYEALLRMRVARASRKYPLLVEMLADGRLHLSGIDKLAPHLTDENYEAFLKSGVRLLVLTLPDCPNCLDWTGQLGEFLASDEDWNQVRFGKIDLESENTKKFRSASEWLEFVEGVPFNVVYLEGEPKASFFGAGVARMVKRLERVCA